MKLFKPQAAFLQVTGDDRLDFVHGLVSNQVRQLPALGTSVSLLLNHRGQALAQLRTLRLHDRLLLVVEDGAGPHVLQEFQSHIFFDQVEVSDVSDRYRLLSLQGEDAAGSAAACSGADIPAEGLFGVAADVFVTRARRSLAGGADLIVAAEQAAALVQRLLDAGASEGSSAELDLLRVQAGVATAAGEGGEGVLPQEAGLEGYVSYRKGCYLGQEIMARIEARGNLRRQLASLSLTGLPAAGERNITLDGRRVGRLGTVAADGSSVLALAVLRNDLAGDAQLEVGGVQARIIPLPAPETLQSRPDGSTGL